MNQVHETLNKNFVYSTADLVAPVKIGVDQIRHFAREAEGRHRCPRSAQAGTTTASHLGLLPQLRTFLLDLDRDAEQA